MIYGSREAYQLMLKQGSGHIIHTASAYGLLPGALTSPYVASKHAVVGFSESLRIEAQDFGIQVSVICPGFIKTPIVEGVEAVNAETEHMRALVPFRLMSPEVAAQKILKGVAKQKRIIIFPFYIHLLLFLYRHFPFLFHSSSLGRIRKFRNEYRQEKNQTNEF